VVAVLALLVLVLFSASTAIDSVYACGGCRSPGFWKNHPDAWPVCEIEIGGKTYTKDEAIEWMKQPVRRDKSLTMFKSLVAAKLNVLSGCSDDCIACTIKEADDWLEAFPVGSGVRANSEAWQYSHGEAIYLALDAYNNGRLCEPGAD
jgi:hypothetical protein